MDYEEIAKAYQEIEHTSSRLEMIDYLAELVRKTPKDLISKVVYLTQGKLYPDFTGIEIGIAEKLAVRTVARATGDSEEAVLKSYRTTGDLGGTAENLLKGKKPEAKSHLTVNQVYDTLDKMANTSGAGTIEIKLDLLSNILRQATPMEAKYILRTVTGKLRLGIADMTMLDALSIVYAGGKHMRKEVERGYNITSDLGQVASTIATEGIKGIQKLGVKAGKPIRPMLAERLPSAQEILNAQGGQCAAEYKYDGERLQIHKTGDKVQIFSRRIENITAQYPDIIELVKKHVKVKEVILEGEVVAIDLETGDLKPFQELMHRRRKYGIQEAMDSYPVSIFLFDILFADGKDYTTLDYRDRRAALEKHVERTDRVRFAVAEVVDDPENLEKVFEEAIEDGCEGIICKAVGAHSIYRAGARGNLWIKYKRDYKSEMTDTVDLVVVGAFYGRGRRAGTYGALLLATYDPESDSFPTITKCGTGFSDKDLAEIPKRLKEAELDHPHPRVNSLMKADVWFAPLLVLEVLGAEITLSPIHPTALNKVREGSGLAVRFPRFTGNYREDKAPEDATTDEEIVEMYQGQLRKVKRT